MKKAARRAPIGVFAASRSGLAVRVARPLGTALLAATPLAAALLAAALLAAALLAALSACTVLDDPFDPVLVASDFDAGPLGRLAVVDPALSENATPLGCTLEGANGSGDAVGSGCSSDVGPSRPGDFVNIELDNGADAGVVAEPEPSVSTASCPSGLGEFGAPELVTGLEFAERSFGPSLSSDGRTLYFSAYVGMEQRIYSATRSDRGAAFSGVTEVPAINAPGSDGTPFITANGQRLYFFSDRPSGVGDRDIWVSQRRGAAFAEPELLPGINAREGDLLPWLSADELTLLFVSSRAGGRGEADLWRATRASVADAFGAPSNVSELNSNREDGRVALAADGLTAYFTSNRGGGRGGADIWRATRGDAGQPFSQLVDLAPLNTDANEQDVLLSSDETELFFASTRRGGRSELWRSTRSCS